MQEDCYPDRLPSILREVTRRGLIRRLAHTWAFLFAVVPVWAGTVYYVNEADGDDSNPGTQMAPWKTIQKAASTMVAGDEVSVAEGSYPERVTVTKSGASGAMISFIASGIVQCQGFTVKGSYIHVHGFKLTAVQPTWSEGRFGIWLEGSNCILESNHYCPTGGIVTWINSSSSIIRSNRCERNCLTGLDIRGNNHIVGNNEIWGTIAHHSLTNWTPTGDVNGIGVSGSGHIFRGNYIHDITFDDPETVGYSPHIDGFQTFAVDTYHPVATNILIEKNRIVLPVYKDFKVKGYAFMLESCHKIIIRNNLTIAFNVMNTAAGSVNHLNIENSTFVGRLSFPKAYWASGIDLQSCIDRASQAGLEISHNCVYNQDGTKPLGSQNPHNLWGVDPSFLNPASLDSHLKPDSPCIDKGIMIPGLVDDIEANPRPSGEARDIGAYEFRHQHQRDQEQTGPSESDEVI